MTIASIAAIALLGRAMQVKNGHYTPEALLWLAAALLAMLAALVTAKRKDASPRSICLAISAALAWQLLELSSRAPIAALAGQPLARRAPFMVGAVVAALLAGGLLFGPRAAYRWLVASLLACWLVLGVLTLSASPEPSIDVFVFQRDAASALLSGQNPYRLTFPNIYPDARFYSPGVVSDGRLLFGFPYPPLSLVLSTAGALLGDPRFAQLLAIAGAAAIMALARPSRHAAGAAALFLFTPRGFFVLEQSWTEPFAVLLLAVTVFAPRRWLALPLGALVAIKQYLVAVLLLVPLLASVGRVRLAAAAGAVALTVTLPFVLWDPAAYAHSVLTLQLGQPFRDDALSFAAGLAHATGTAPSAVIAFVALLAACGAALAMAPRTSSGFALALALAYATFFAWSKQAFCNYYYFVAGALCLAVASRTREN